MPAPVVARKLRREDMEIPWRVALKNVADAVEHRKSPVPALVIFGGVPKGLSTVDGVTRCGWCGDDPLYVRYHDSEWGFPVRDDTLLFEKLCLEGFQSGLSWLTILRKRQNFRAAFQGFDVARVARFRAHDVARLLGDAGIVRHRGKVESVVHNARRCLELQEECGSLHAFVRRYQPEPRARAHRVTWDVLRAMPFTGESTALSKGLKRRGWTFVGPTTCYAFMQAVGLVNDHLHGCDIRERAARRRMGRA